MNENWEEYAIYDYHSDRILSPVLESEINESSRQIFEWSNDQK
jgi:hypothetical protein